MIGRFSFAVAGSLTLVAVLAMSPRIALAVPPPGGVGSQIHQSLCIAPNAPPSGQSGTLTLGSITAAATVVATQPPAFSLASGASQPQKPKSMSSATFTSTQGACTTVWTYVKPTYTLSVSGTTVVTFTYVETVSHTSVPSGAPAATATPGGPPHP
jgi:hypothetical protein